MPSAMHPQAKFDPIPPDLDLCTLVETTPNFDFVPRLSLKQITEGRDLKAFEEVVLRHVIIGGKPLVIDGWEAELPPWLFSPTWLIENVGTKVESVRDMGNATDMPMTIGHYMNSLPQLAKNMTPKNFRDPRRQRLYLKDIDCPDAWYQKLEQLMPPQLFYYNENISEKGGLGAVRDRNPFGQINLGKGAGPAGDLMSSLPPEMRAQNFMCYIGHEGTYTPAHREMCGSLGQNIMVETSTSDAGEIPGSSIWFMTEYKDREVVSEFFLSMLGHDIEIENHFAQINAWKKAPFPVYVVEQKVGDFILIPPLAPHQVWNCGTRTMKAAWNRTTVETLELAIHEALPRARLVCRDEQYKNKAIIYYTLQKYADLLDRVENQGGAIPLDEHGRQGSGDSSRFKQLQKDFRRLFDLFTEIMITEMFDPARPEKEVEFIKYDSNVTCSYCRCNIFNRFLTCKSCLITSVDGEIEDTYDVCMECYAMGRSCACVSNLAWVEQWQWPELTSNHEKWRGSVISILASLAIDGQIDLKNAPQPLDIMRQRFGKTPVAQICQEQLKKRPFRDPSKPYIPVPFPGDSDNEPEADDNGNLIKKKMSKRMSEQLKKTHHSCHICRKKEENWKLAFCCSCSRAYCYGVLYRAFDLMPQTVMETTDWKCPQCLKICSCAACRRGNRQRPYQPKGTLLGHDTKKVADYRSVESLVDFGRTNLGWLREEDDGNPQTSQRMRNLLSKATEEKARGTEMEDDAAGDAEDERHSNQGQIDPRLGGGVVAKPVAPIYANAYEGAGLIPEYDRNGMNTPPEHDDDFQFAYPEPPEFDGRERVMGAGYYQQQPGPEAILYTAPDAASSHGESAGPELEYPKLPEPETVHATRKRKRTSMARPQSPVVDDAHKEYMQAQKRQKLTDARANDKFFMTQSQLEGGKPLVIKFPVPRDFHNLKTSSNRKARPTRDSFRAMQDEDDIENMAGSPKVVKSDVQPMIDSDDEFDLSLQAMNNFQSSRTAPDTTKSGPTNKTKGFSRRGGKRTLGTRGTATTQTSRARRDPPEQLDSEITGEAFPSSRGRRRSSTESAHLEPEIDDSDHGFAARNKRSRGSATKSTAKKTDLAPSLSTSRDGRANRDERQRRRCDTTLRDGSEEEQAERFVNRRPAGKRPGRALKFTQPVNNDKDDDEYVSDASPPTAQVLSDGVSASSESEELVVPTLVPKRRARPIRQMRSLGFAIPLDEPMLSPAQRSRRKSAPVVATMVFEVEREEEIEIPETNEHTHGFTPLNRRELGRWRDVGARRLPAPVSKYKSIPATQEQSEASVNGRPARARRSVRFEGMPEKEQPNSPPRLFASFDESDAHPSPEPIDDSIFQDKPVLGDRDDVIDAGRFPRGSQQHLDHDGDVEMDRHIDSEPEDNPRALERPKKLAKNGQAQRGRPDKSNLIVIDDSDEAPSSALRIHTSCSKATTPLRDGFIITVENSAALSVSQASSSSSSSLSDSEESSPPLPKNLDAKGKAVDRRVSPFLPKNLGTEGKIVDRRVSPPISYEEEQFDTESSNELTSPAAPKLSRQRPKALSRVMTEQERIINENRRAKQSILVGLDNDYYSSEYYSASEGEEPESKLKRQREQQEPYEKSIPNPKEAIAREDDDEAANSVSPYFSKSAATSTLTSTVKNANPLPLSDKAKKFSRSVAAARMADQKRRPGILNISSAKSTPAPAESSMLSLADRRALAGKKSNFAILRPGEALRDKYGSLVKKDSSGSATSSIARSSKKPVTTAVPNMNGSGPGSASGSGIFGCRKRANSAAKKMAGTAQQESDEDESDTSIPTVRPKVIGYSRRGGGGMGMLESICARSSVNGGGPRPRGRESRGSRVV